MSLVLSPKHFKTRRSIEKIVQVRTVFNILIWKSDFIWCIRTSKSAIHRMIFLWRSLVFPCTNSGGHLILRFLILTNVKQIWGKMTLRILVFFQWKQNHWIENRVLNLIVVDSDIYMKTGIILNKINWILNNNLFEIKINRRGESYIWFEGKEHIH